MTACHTAKKRFPNLGQFAKNKKTLSQTGTARKKKKNNFPNSRRLVKKKRSAFANWESM